MCPYCGAFEWSPARNNLFRNHPESKNTLESHTPMHSPGILPCYLSPLPVLTVSVLGTTPRTSSNPLPRSWGRTSHGLGFRQLTASYPGLTAPHLAGARLVPRRRVIVQSFALQAVVCLFFSCFSFEGRGEDADFADDAVFARYMYEITIWVIVNHAHDASEP